MSSIDDPSVQAIDAKSKDKGDDNKERTVNDWGAFAKSVVQNLINIFLLILLIANTLFYVESDKLNQYFPTELSKYLTKPAKIMKGGRTCKGIKAPSVKINRPNISLLNESGLGGNVYGWPYSMYEKDEEDNKTFKNWFAMVVAKTYIFTRMCWKKIYGFGLLKNPDLHIPDGVYIILAPLMAMIASIPTILSPFVSLYYGFTEEWWWGLIYTICIIPICLICYSVPFLQMLLFFFMILVAPLMINKEKVSLIAQCNQGLFGFLFGALVVGSAFQYLIPSIGYSALGLWIILLLKHLFM